MLKKENIIADWSADMYEIDETGTEDVAFLLSCLGTIPKRILEIACGSGRILVPLAKAGHTVVGLDMDEAMLRKIPAKAEGVDNISWRIADAVSEDWGTGYDVVVIAGNFLMNIVSDEGPERAQKVLLEKAKLALKPGGMLYIDYNYTFYPEQWYVHPGERVIWQGTDGHGTTGRMLLCDSTYDAATGLIRSMRHYELHGKPHWIEGHHRTMNELTREELLDSFRNVTKENGIFHVEISEKARQGWAAQHLSRYAEKICSQAGKEHKIMEMTVGAGVGTNAIVRSMTEEMFYMGVDIDFTCAKNADAIGKYYGKNAIGL